MESSELRVLIADDEELGRGKIRLLLRSEPDVRIVAECADGDSAAAQIRALRPDVLFLDVQMPRGNGLQVLSDVGAADAPVTIFVTAHEEYAVRAFEASAVDYLLKPFGAERFAVALDRARTAVRHRREAGLDARLQTLMESLPAREPFPDRFMVKSGAEYVFVRADEVDWVEAADNYVTLHVGARKHMLRGSLNAFERQLSPRRFLRIRRSSIVNLDRVRAVRPYSGAEYEVVLTSGATLLTGRTYRDQVRAALFGPDARGR